MDNHILLLLPISTKVSESKSKLKQSKRKQQYLEGIQKVLEYPHIKQFDIVLIDNTTTEKDVDLQNTLPFVSEYMAVEKNDQGQRNIGAGILQVWDYLKADLATYDWIIHFEPRQYMKDYRIFDMFLKDPQNIFMYGNQKKDHYYTGIFTLKSSDLLEYLTKVDAKTLTRKRIGLEYSMYTHLKDKNIKIVDEVGIRWHDRVKNRYLDL